MIRHASPLSTLLPRAALLIALSAPPLTLGACDASDGVPAAEADTSTETDAETARDTSATRDTSAEADTAEPQDTTPSYPPGPYGAEYLDTIRPDLSFYDPWTGLDHAMADYFGDPSVKILLLSSAAGWCTACEYEAWDLVDAYTEYHPDGLEVLYTLYEDSLGKPLWRDPDEINDDFTFMNLWHDNIGPRVGLELRQANFPVLVDIGWTLGDYYDKSATPFTLMIRTRDMKVVYRDTGYAAGVIDVHIKTALYSN